MVIFWRIIIHDVKLVDRICVTATTLMIRNVSVTADDDFIHITWSVPKFLPASYQVNVSCRLTHTETEYMQVMLALSPFDKMLTVDKLFPESDCVFTLLAIYNPASIDDGITGNISTRNTSVYL